MNIGTAINQFVQKQLDQQKLAERFSKLSTEELTEIWDAWDGTEAMTIHGEYVDEREVYFELNNRGVKPEY